MPSSDHCSRQYGTRQNDRAYLAQEKVAEVGHELSCAAATHILVAEELKGLFQCLVEQAAVGKAVTDVQHVLVMQLNDCSDKMLLPGATCSAGLNVSNSMRGQRGEMSRPRC